MENQLVETWLPVFDDDVRYEVSNLGEVRKWNDDHTESSILMKYPLKSKFLTVSMRGKTYYIHRIVGKTFLDNPNNYKMIHHIDGNRRNNRVDNLEWCTYSEIQKSRYKDLGRLKTYILCQETGEMFSTMQTVSLLTGIPYGVIKKSIHEESVCFGKHYVVRNISIDTNLDAIKHVSMNDFYDASKTETDYDSWYRNLIKTI